MGPFGNTIFLFFFVEGVKDSGLGRGLYVPGSLKDTILSLFLKTTWVGGVEMHGGGGLSSFCFPVYFVCPYSWGFLLCL